MIIYNEAKRNDPCPCGSGIKFKACCDTSYRKAMRVIRAKDARIKKLLIEVLKERGLVRAKTDRKVVGSVVYYYLESKRALKVDYEDLPMSLHSKQDIETVSRVDPETIKMTKWWIQSVIEDKKISE